MPKKMERQLIEFHSNDEGPSDVDDERPVSGKGHSSEGSSQKAPLLTVILAVEM